MYSEYEVSLKDVFLSEIGIIIDDEESHWYDRCKNNNIDCESGRGMNRLCSDCQRDKIDEAKDYCEDQEYDNAINRQESREEAYD